MVLPPYFRNIAIELNRKSESIRGAFFSHHGSAGENRESLVAEFLRDYLPNRYGIDTGLINSFDGQFSNQADLIIADTSFNSPLYPSSPNRIWLVEAVYALIEVKTSLSPSDIQDSVDKCRRFKRLPRKFSDAPSKPSIADSLFILWAFESSKSETLKLNLVKSIVNVPRAEQPDFVIVPGQLVAMSGQYMELAKHGQHGSEYRKKLEKQHGPDLTGLQLDLIQVDECGPDSLFVWLIWMLSWLKRAGSRSSELLAYLPPDVVWGRRV